MGIRVARTLRRTLGPAVLCLGCAAGCGTSDGGTVVSRSDSAGVEIVVNRGGDRVLTWSFTPRVTLGGADSGPASFYDVSGRGVAVDGAGRLYVLDASAFRVAAFDAAGRHLWSAGTEGQGPGELASPIALTASDDGLVSVVDATGMKIEHFDSAGGYIGGDRLASPPWMSEFGRSGIALIVNELPVLLSDQPRERLLRISADDTTELASVELEPRQRLRFDDCPIGVAMPPIFGADVRWASSDDMAVATTGPEYVVQVFERERLSRSYRRDLDPTPATEDLAAAQIPDGMTLRAGAAQCDISPEEAVEKRGFGPLVPMIRGLAIAPDGSLWVQRTPGRNGRAAFDVLSPDGAYVGSLENAPLPAAFMPDGSVVGIETDELDIDRIVVYEVER